MRKPYPPIEPYAKHDLAVTPPHVLHVEECGNPKGLPVIFVHGGPGGGFTENDRCFFDPQVYRIILFDQRGCGRSKPSAELLHNTTQDLLLDMEIIREFFKIDRWVVFGGSWGSTLSLVYAETFPHRVLGLIVRGIFLSREEDVRWLYDGGAGSIFPDYWNDFLMALPEEERDNCLEAYYKRLTSPDPEVRHKAAQTWVLWEGRCASLLPNARNIELLSEPQMAINFARISCHYFLNKCFLQNNQILNNVYQLRDIPGIIVHGRYDILCPVENAYTLHAAWSRSELNIIPGAGHVTSEPGISDALIAATQQIAWQCEKETADLLPAGQ